MADVCPANSRCRNTVGSYKCKCKRGYEEVTFSNGTTICVGTVSCSSCCRTFDCWCLVLSRENTSDLSLSGKDPCEDNTCDPANSVCRSRRKGPDYWCACDKGYRHARGSNKVCKGESALYHKGNVRFPECRRTLASSSLVSINLHVLIHRGNGPEQICFQMSTNARTNGDVISCVRIPQAVTNAVAGKASGSRLTTRLVQVRPVPSVASHLKNTTISRPAA